jgi:hypothetical protein
VTWFSQTARPQKRHVATAVRRQCQQFIPALLPSGRTLFALEGDAM